MKNGKKEQLHRSFENLGVDVEAKQINGYIVAEEGEFKSGRGRFTLKSLKKIVQLMKSHKKGTPVNFHHNWENLGKFLGRSINPRLEEVTRNGETVSVIRADLKLSNTAFEMNPNGNIGGYVLALADEDADAIGSSLTLMINCEYEKDNQVPIWMPFDILSSDIVGEGDATKSLLSVNADDENEELDDKSPENDSATALNQKKQAARLRKLAVRNDMRKRNHEV